VTLQFVAVISTTT